MTSRGQCPRGVCVLVNVFTPPPFQEILYISGKGGRHARKQKCLKCLLSVLLAVCTCGADVWWPGADLGGGGALPARAPRSQP